VLVNTDEGGQLEIVTGHANPVLPIHIAPPICSSAERARFSPDGNSLLTTQVDGATVMRDAQTGKERHRVESADVVQS